MLDNQSVEQGSLEATRQSNLRPRSRRKAELGQFMTPMNVAKFMVSLFSLSKLEPCYVLDAGAGQGALSTAFLNYCIENDLALEQVALTAYEIDECLHKELLLQLSQYTDISVNIVLGDYIDLVTAKLAKEKAKYTHIILNPPYKKINSKSDHRLNLRSAGIETVNLYSAFVALALTECAHGAQLIAIIPRSFCNGPYYRPFRDFLLKRASVVQIHLFESRTSTFKEESVLQENIILKLVCGVPQGKVTISTSTDDGFYDLASYEFDFNQIIFPDDPEKIIHIPTSPTHKVNDLPEICYTLNDIGVSISTGPVVDFRLLEYLRENSEAGTVPLLYPSHFHSGICTWPLKESRKSKKLRANAIVQSCSTEKWLYPNGFYCVVRRLSSKEEKRRVVASIVNPLHFGDVKMLGFENHLNLFHENKHGLPKDLAYGLTAYLNTKIVDDQFRRFNGHTQVNATDLKSIKYPSREILSKLGSWFKDQTDFSLDAIELRLRKLINDRSRK